MRRILRDRAHAFTVLMAIIERMVDRRRVSPTRSTKRLETMIWAASDMVDLSGGTDECLRDTWPFECKKLDEWVKIYLEEED